MKGICGRELRIITHKEMSIVDFIINNFIDSAYCIGYRTEGKNFWEEKVSYFNILKPGLRYWYADPIPVSIMGIDYVFVEKYDRIRQIGFIGVSEVKNRKIKRPKTIIKRKTHMSFPVITSYKGDYYMFPESSETMSIEIYKMCNDPYHWEHYYSFNMNEKIVDIAIKEKEDTFLLLAGIIDKDPLYVKRQIIEIKNLDESDKITFNIGYTDKEPSLKVRNGGNFQKDYRIVQESTKSDYGLYLRLNKIIVFNRDEIVEEYCAQKTVSDINIDLSRSRYRKIGIHTYGKCNSNLEVIDVAVTQLSIYPLLRRWRKRCKQIMHR